jgi:DNA (cytosine-5)-methyltransferase 1
VNVVSLFSGVGGFDLGLERAGFTVVAQVENDPFCQRVLATRWPSVARWPAVREWQGNGHEPIALLVGGFPCQDLSVAGKRAGLSGLRSSLFYEYVRIAKALQPTFGLVENVPGLISSHRGRDFWLVLQGLRECWPCVGWRVVDSQYFGVPQRRRRVFLVGGPTEAGVAEVLALTESSSGDSAAGDEAGQDVAYALAASVRGTGDQHGNAWNSTYVTANGLTHRYGKGTDSDVTDTLITGPLGGGNDGIGRRSEDDPNLVVAGTFQNTGHGWCNQTPIAQSVGTPEGGGSLEANLVTHALTCEGHDASEDGTGRGTPLVFDLAQVTNPHDRSNPQPGDPSRTLHGEASRMVRIERGQTIRRLTPLECERLQGFPDGWTCLCTPLDAYATDPDAAALACRCPDSPRYRALGNAVTVNVITWLGQRLARVMMA